MEEVSKLLEELKDFIQTRDIDKYTYYKMLGNIAKLEEALGVSKTAHNEIVFTYENEFGKGRIIKQGVDGSFIIEFEEGIYDADHYIHNSLEEGYEYKNEGVYDTFEEALAELEDAIESFTGETIDLSKVANNKTA